MSTVRGRLKVRKGCLWVVLRVGRGVYGEVGLCMCAGIYVRARVCRCLYVCVCVSVCVNVCACIYVCVNVSLFTQECINV